MRYLTIPALALLLAGCQSINVQTADEAIAANLGKACLAMQVGHSGFLAVNEIRPLSASVIRAELIAYNRAAGLCSNPEADTAAVLQTVLAASLEIAKALSAAERAGP